MIIGLIGAPKAGKDEIAKFFVFKGFKRLAFADKIKESFYAETGYTEEQFKQSRGTELEQIIRDSLWDHSARICDKFGAKYFINQVVDTIGKDNVIITDVRTDLELEALEIYKAKIALVLRNFREELKGRFLLGTKLRLDKIILYPKIWNIYGLEEIYMELDKFYEEIREK